MTSLEIWKARAPLRVDFGGGPSDVEPFCSEHGGCVVNGAIDIYAKVTICTKLNKHISVWHGRKKVGSWEVPLALSEDGELKKISPLVWAALSYIQPKSGLRIDCEIEAPPGSGLGGSSALLVAMLAGLRAAFPDKIGPEENLARLATELESNQAGVLAGGQDQLAAFHGGIMKIDFSADGPVVSSINLTESQIRRMSKSLILVDTQEQHKSSGDIIENVVRNYESGNISSIKKLKKLAKIAEQIAISINNMEIEEVGRLCRSSWEAQKELSDLINTDRVEHVINKMNRCSIYGSKITGAGGGGYVLAVFSDKRRMDVIKCFEKNGLAVREVKLVSRGVEVSKEAS